MMVTARWNGAVIAESDDTVVVEGNHYFPADSLDPALIEDSEQHSLCPWKGTALYKTLVVGGQRNPNAAWYYPDPKPAAKQIAGRFAFWKGVTVA
jgi:uncharacterized protein (DUF427 family)